MAPCMQIEEEIARQQHEAQRGVAVRHMPDEQLFFEDKVSKGQAPCYQQRQLQAESLEIAAAAHACLGLSLQPAATDTIRLQLESIATCLSSASSNAGRPAAVQGPSGASLRGTLVLTVLYLSLGGKHLPCFRTGHAWVCRWPQADSHTGPSKLSSICAAPSQRVS